MSVIWIKVDRKKKTHSIYCDGRVTSADGDIRDEDKCKFQQLIIGNKNILIGASGISYNCDYLLNNISNNLTYEIIIDILKLIKDPKNIRIAEEKLNNVIEKTLFEKFKNNKIDYFPIVILSIDGNLFYGAGYNFTEMSEDESPYYKFSITYKNKNHIECGSAYLEVKTILEYDINADQQKLLDVAASMETTINNHLFKLENIPFKNEEKEIN